MYGDDDETIPYQWSEYVNRELTRLGVRIECLATKDKRHEFRMSQLLKIEQWARELLPALLVLVHKL